jgi:hypothetical protein
MNKESKHEVKKVMMRMIKERRRKTWLALADEIQT